jgi:hypothetical protein
MRLPVSPDPEQVDVTTSIDRRIAQELAVREEQVEAAAVLDGAMTRLARALTVPRRVPTADLPTPRVPSRNVAPRAARNRAAAH